MADGSQTTYWYYKFKLAGKRYQGSTFCQNKSDAIAFEVNRKIEIREAKKTPTICWREY